MLKHGPTPETAAGRGVAAEGIGGIGGMTGIEPPERIGGGG
jgi:hypothetical protein